MTQETAVSWLVNELPQVDWSDPHWSAKLEQAKAIEKEQIEQAYMMGLAWMMPEDSERVTIVKSKWDI